MIFKVTLTNNFKGVSMPQNNFNSKGKQLTKRYLYFLTTYNTPINMKNIKKLLLLPLKEKTSMLHVIYLIQLTNNRLLKYL